jgi:nitroreductase
MDFKDLIEARYSVRTFKDLPVEQEKVDLILRAGQLAPTAGNRQPQRIIAINDDAAALAKIDETTRCRFGARLVFAVGFSKEDSWIRPFDSQSSGWVDASIVTTHMMLQAADVGIGSTWVMFFDADKLISEFNIPEIIVPVALLVCGYPAEDASPSPMHNQRKSITEYQF